MQRIRSLQIVISLLLVIGILVFQCPEAILAEDITLPEEFYGEITINNMAAPEGTEILTKIDGVERGSLIVIDGGLYGGTETFDSRLIVSGQENDIGKSISFFINGDLANQSVLFEPGQSVELYLSVNIYPLESEDNQISDALDFLRMSQDSDGKIGSYVASSWLIIAIAAAGEDPQDWSNDGDSIIDYMKVKASSNLTADKATDWERSILAIVAAGENPYSFGDTDYVATLLNFFDGTQMGDNSLLNDDIWALPALVSVGAGSDIIPDIVYYIEENQNSDGGWNWAVGGDSDADNTAAAISALIRAGVDPDDVIITNALTYLKTQQQNNGGFTSEGSTNSAVDAWVILAIHDAKQDPTAEEWRVGENNPVSHLLSLQDSDGAFKWTSSIRSNPEWMTAYAITALLGADWPQDRDAPVINGLSPASKGSVSGNSKTISASYSDAISGIDNTSAAMWLDNTAVDAQATNTKISYSATGLSTDSHSVKVSIADRAGNIAEKSWTFKATRASSNGGGGGHTSTTSTPISTATPTPALPPGVTDVDSLTDSSGYFTQAIAIHSQDEKCNLMIETGVMAMTKDKQPVNQISITGMTEAPEDPSEARIVGLVYNLGPEGAAFDPPLTLTYNYDPASLPQGISENSLTIATWDATNGKWIELESTVDSVNHNIQAKVSHFSTYGIIAHISPANFTLDSLIISPANAELNQTINIQATVSNSGDINGNYEVSLNVDDALVKTQTLTVAGHKQKDIIFELTSDKAGSHIVDVGGLTGTFIVKSVKQVDALVIQSLTLEHSEYLSGEKIIITASVLNDGDQIGTFNLSLKVNDQMVDSQVVTLTSGEEQEINFSYTPDEPGNYQASLNNMSVPFSVNAAPLETKNESVTGEQTFSWMPVLEIGAGIVIVALIIALVLSRRKSK